MHEIVEEMASNQQSWANQFAPFLQKMLENGVDVENLSEAQAINDIGSCKVNWRGEKLLAELLLAYLNFVLNL